MSLIELNNILFTGNMNLIPLSSGDHFSVSQSQIVNRDAAAQLFGYAVAGSSDTLVVGAYAKEAAYLYSYNGNSWVENVSLSGFTAGARFGYSTAISGDWIAVASVPTAAAGTVYLYKRTNSVWSNTPFQQITPTLSGAGFGYSIALDGNTLVIGHQSATANGIANQGAAEVWTFNGSAWTKQTTLSLPSGTIQPRLGWSVAVSGDLVAVGGPGSTAGTGSGRVLVSTRTGSSWSAPTIINNGVTDGLGASVVIRQGKVIIGAPANIGTESGRVHIYSGSGSTWSLETTLTVASSGTPTILDTSATNANGRTGWTVDANADGSVIVAGANVFATGGLSAVGTAYIFQKIDDVWGGSSVNTAGVSRISPSSPTQNMRFGTSLSMCANGIVVGAPGAAGVVGGFYWFK